MQQTPMTANQGRVLLSMMGGLLVLVSAFQVLWYVAPPQALRPELSPPFPIPLPVVCQEPPAILSVFFAADGHYSEVMAALSKGGCSVEGVFPGDVPAMLGTPGADEVRGLMPGIGIVVRCPLQE